MNVLLDTHILIWYTEADNQLSASLVSAIENPSNNIFISVASFYEIVIKLKIEKLCLTKTIEQLFNQTQEANIQILPIHQTHLSQYLNLPFYQQHRDPFDRLIISTAIANNFTIITSDKNFSLYKGLVEILV